MARKILLADDSVTAQNMGRKILADAGYEVIAVNNGSAALKKIAELKPDLVILDVYMPGYSGLEVCQRLRESQETARIPVLLSVGKLEPFKPEEAQRVRADGFIVKPFEASELLSALSKLEDKVVPRAEPSKPGRFARAVAAAEESGRGSKTASNGSGWKSRIGFPHEKTEPEQKVADESSIYNLMNRDLRTVVETAAEKEEEGQPAGKAAETTVDVAALAPAGLPSDVTPEELAAIAAAAAQIQMAGAAIKDEHQVSITTSQASLERASDRVEDNLPSPPDVYRDCALPVNVATTTEAPQESKEESKIEEPQQLPVTMAATAESVVAASPGASQWTAVPVALEGEEATISLDQEMQKAYAAFAAAEANSAAGASVPEVAAAPAGNSSARTETTVEAPVAAIANPEPEPVPEAAPGMSAEATKAQPAAVAHSEAAAVASSFMAADFVAAEPASLPEPANASPANASPANASPANASNDQPEAAFPAPVPEEVATVEAPAETAPTAEFAEPHPEPAPVAEFVIPVAEAEIARPAALGTQELQPAPEAEPASAEAATASLRAFAPIVHSPENVAEDVAENPAQDAAEPKPDPATVKSTAAAWASWRQIRDTSKGSEVARSQPKEFEVPESAPAETAARAVAAGAEQIVQEASVASSSSDPAAIASIVDSVLADLRPKLMAEISRKMAEKK